MSLECPPRLSDFMILRWYRRRRRRRILDQPFPPGWNAILESNVAHDKQLSGPERRKLRQLVQVFVTEKYWEGCRGLEMTDEIKVTIAGQACLMLLGFEEAYFDRLLTVLVYPDEYVVQETAYEPSGVVTESRGVRLGEAWHAGPVVLSWDSVLEGTRFPHAGHNVVLHEFAHVLDMQDHVFNGTPLLENARQYRNWREVMTAEYNQLLQQVQRGRATFLDDYGATNEAEFFAVATEAFFCKPRRMADRNPRLYRLLADFYRQDPSERAARPAGREIRDDSGDGRE